MATTNKVIKWLYGNRLRLTIPMKIVIMSTGGKTIEDYAPTDVESISVVLSGSRSYVFTPEIDGNTIIVDDNATLLVGKYDMTVLVVESDGTRRRSKWLQVIEIYDANNSIVDAKGNFIDYVDGSVIKIANRKLKWLYGNKMTFAIPMKMVTIANNVRTIEDYVPTGEIRVVFEGDRRYVFKPEINENVLLVIDNAILPVGTYDMVILVQEEDGTKRRSKWGGVIEICDSNSDVSDVYGVDFPDGEIVDVPTFFHSEKSVVDAKAFFYGTTADYNDLKNKPVIPTHTSELTNDSGFITEHQSLDNYYTKNEIDDVVSEKANINDIASLETDPTVPSHVKGITASDISKWNGKQEAGSYVTTNTQQTITAQKSFNSRVNFLGTGDANAIYLTTDTRIDVHGTSYTVLGFASGTFLINHTSYNLRLRGKGTRPTYNDDTKPLALLSDVPTKVSQLTNDSGFITTFTETDPVFSSSVAASITSADISAWNCKSDFSGSYNDLTDKPVIPTVPTNVSEFENDAGYLTSHQSLVGYATEEWVGQQGYITAESDPTVPAWAKQSSKPTYTASEVGALPASTAIPTKTSQLQNDSGFLTEHQSLSGYATEQWVEGKGYLTSYTETDPTVPAWAKQSSKPTYTAQEVGALPSSTTIPDELSDLADDSTHRLVTDTEKSTWNGKQAALVSGTNIKTINNESILGSGNISTSSVIFRQW